MEHVQSNKSVVYKADVYKEGRNLQTFDCWRGKLPIRSGFGEQ